MKRVWAILLFFTQIGFIVFTYLVDTLIPLIRNDSLANIRVTGHLLLTSYPIFMKIEGVLISSQLTLI